MTNPHFCGTIITVLQTCGRARTQFCQPSHFIRGRGRIVRVLALSGSKACLAYADCVGFRIRYLRCADLIQYLCGYVRTQFRQPPHFIRGYVRTQFRHPPHFIRGYGGIGRRARFRIWYLRCAGSSPVTRTISSVHNGFELWALDFLLFSFFRMYRSRFVCSFLFCFSKAVTP